MPRRAERKFLASEALARGVNKKHFGGAGEAGTPPRNCRALLGLDGSETRPHTGAGLSPGFREKHAEPKAQDVIVSSLQNSVVAYLYPALTRWAEIFRSCGAEMREVGHSPEA